MSCGCYGRATNPDGLFHRRRYLGFPIRGDLTLIELIDREYFLSQSLLECKMKSWVDLSKELSFRFYFETAGAFFAPSLNHAILFGHLSCYFDSFQLFGDDGMLLGLSAVVLDNRKKRMRRGYRC